MTRVQTRRNGADQRKASLTSSSSLLLVTVRRRSSISCCFFSSSPFHRYRSSWSISSCCSFCVARLDFSPLISYNPSALGDEDEKPEKISTRSSDVRIFSSLVICSFNVCSLERCASFKRCISRLALNSWSFKSSLCFDFNRWFSSSEDVNFNWWPRSSVTI